MRLPTCPPHAPLSFSPSPSLSLSLPLTHTADVLEHRGPAAPARRDRRHRAQQGRARPHAAVPVGGGAAVGAVEVTSTATTTGRVRTGRAGVRVLSGPISPQWGSIRFPFSPRTYAPWGVRVVPDRLTKSRKVPTRKTSPLFFVSRCTPAWVSEDGTGCMWMVFTQCCPGHLRHGAPNNYNVLRSAGKLFPSTTPLTSSSRSHFSLIVYTSRVSSWTWPWHDRADSLTMNGV